MAKIVLMSLGALLLAACAAKPKPPPEESKIPLDRSFARMLSSGETDQALRMADSVLVESSDLGEHEIAAYWKAMAWLYKDIPDSALTILEANKGKWKGGFRMVHAEAFLHLAREASQARAAAKAKHDELVKAAQDKVFQEKIDALQKENGDLRTQVTGLETEKQKYEKLLKDLETIR